MKNIFIPFEKISNKFNIGIWIFWILILSIFWILMSFGETHLFPTPKQVLKGFSDLYNQGLVTHIYSSLSLCFMAILISIIVSCLISYLFPIPFLKPIAIICSKFRFLPLTGITFYLALLINDARTMQIWVLVVFMSTYLTTSLVAMIKDIPEEEFNHARSLQCSRLEVLLEVIIKGRVDYVLEVIRQNLAIVWMMLVTVESILAAAGGLGFLIKNSDKFMNHGRIIALQLVILFLGLSIDWVMNFLRKRLFRYSTM